ncbi:unnamed protein product, partial [Scytosiphon promiscuus]
PLGNAFRVVVQVAAGAEHMHKNGISHGDIKPQNILMIGGKDGSLVPQLADFGTARGESLTTAVVTAVHIWHGNITKSTLKWRGLQCQAVAEVTHARTNVCLAASAHMLL